jgi:2-dehydro-3-deoxyphosphooctonate aldolase (KDO 8-P synthase)
MYRIKVFMEFQIENMTIGGSHPLVLIAGPCVLEGREMCLLIASEVKALCEDLGVPFIFKGSFDKANRQSIDSPRGPGIEEGLAILSEVRAEFGVPVLTDVHETNQVAEVAKVVDIVQIPAFLCRQTDLLLAAANSGKTVNIKKGQFLAPQDMASIAAKAASTGNNKILLTERGSFFGYGNLVADMRCLPIMRGAGYPVAFDATHAVQRPGGQGGKSGGDREFIPHLVRAACAVGIDALFLEVHPNPESALSDAATMLPLTDLRSVLEQAVAIDALVKSMAGPNL